MAQGNRYTCKCCGTEYTYCPSCAIKQPSYDAESFCSVKHATIFEILSKNGCKLASAEETLLSLSMYDLDTEKLTPSIRRHIASIKASVKPIEEIKPVEEVEFVEEVKPVEEQRRNFKPYNKEKRSDM